MNLGGLPAPANNGVYVCARACVCSWTEGRDKMNVESEYVQLNPLKGITAELFEEAIDERRAVVEAKDKFRSQSASGL